jgi:Domain of unknown function (DUF4292)
MLKQYQAHSLLILLFFTLCSMQQNGCKGKKNNADAGPMPATTQRKTDDLLKKLDQNMMAKAEWLSGSARIRVDGSGQSIAANVNIIWKRDSAIWLNVKKLGIEGVRALVTRDSVYLINRLEKYYSIKSIATLQREYGLPGGFDALQNTLLGQPWFFKDILLQSDIRDSLHRLSGSNNFWLVDYRMREGSFTLAASSYLQKKEGRSAGLSFENYKKTPFSGYFPYLRRIEAFSPETGEMNLEIEFNDVDLNTPKTWRFDIPKHYDRRD